MSTRRSFVRRLLGAAAALALPPQLLADRYAHDLDHYKAGVFKTPAQRRRGSCLPPGQHVFFNGEDFQCRANECHTREGWIVEVVKVPSDYLNCTHGGGASGAPPVTIRYVKRFGCVELRPA
jgi:hypothetical protein